MTQRYYLKLFDLFESQFNTEIAKRLTKFSEDSKDFKLIVLNKNYNEIIIFYKENPLMKIKSEFFENTFYYTFIYLEEEEIELIKNKIEILKLK